LARLALLDGAKGLYVDILRQVESRLKPGTLVLADDARHCPEFVGWMRSDANRY
jgi:predicted O-methyltransferase YrrM